MLSKGHRIGTRRNRQGCLVRDLAVFCQTQRLQAGEAGGEEKEGARKRSPDDASSICSNSELDDGEIETKKSSMMTLEEGVGNINEKK